MRGGEGFGKERGLRLLHFGVVPPYQRGVPPKWYGINMVWVNSFPRSSYHSQHTVDSSRVSDWNELLIPVTYRLHESMKIAMIITQSHHEVYISTFQS